jgi:5-deoxy-glucuronate isomerase
LVADVTPENAGWQWTGLQVIDLTPGETLSMDTEGRELLVVPLSGSAMVECDGEGAQLAGRSSVFAAVTDFAYAGRGTSLTIHTDAGGRFALPWARARRGLPFRHIPAEDVEIELRGAGSASRQVNNLCTPRTMEADRLIACEILTPGGNWSSYPPHKHDIDSDAESCLEEIYYYEVADGGGGPGVAYQRVYGTQDRPIDVRAEVRSGDVVLVPHGWHGPTMAAPGYDLYYLNAMAGPGPERAWRICDDPSHAWVRGTWATDTVDPRLPLARPR